MAKSSAVSTRRAVASESFKTASECVGSITPGMALFAITRGQFSMIDAILACLDQVGPAAVSLWTWTVAEYEIRCLQRLQADARLTSGLLVIDEGARDKNRALLQDWQKSFGPKSVRYVITHAKIACIETPKWKILLRGSMNLNFNPRFEQFDLTEGGPDFDLVKQIETEIPILPDTCTRGECYAGSKVSGAFTKQQLSIFQGIKTWAK